MKETKKAEGVKELGPFALAVMRAAAIIEAEGVSAVHTAEADKKPRKKRRASDEKKLIQERIDASQARLLAVVAGGDLDAAKAEVALGADPLGPFKISGMLFSEWAAGVDLRGGGSVEGDAAGAMLCWLDDMGVPFVKNGPQRYAQTYAGLKKRARVNPVDWRKHRLSEIAHLISEGIKNQAPMARAVVTLAKKWASDPNLGTRVALLEWFDELMISSDRDRSLAIELVQEGVVMTEDHWNMVALSLRENTGFAGWQSGEGASTSVVELAKLHVARGGKKISGESLAQMLCHAIDADDLTALGIFASLGEEAMWRLPWGMSLVEQAAGASMSRMRWIRSYPQTAKTEELRCLRALAFIPEAVAAQKLSPQPGLFLLADLEDVKRVSEMVPSLLWPDKQGNTFVHEWIGNGGSAETKKAIDLLRTDWASWGMKRNKAGETPLGLAMASKRLSDEEKARLQKAYVSYEKRAIKSEAGRAAKGSQAKPKRL